MENLPIPKKNFFAVDLKRPLQLERRFDLVLSLEVAEHLPEECAATFVESLIGLGSVILFSAAIPFQGGTHHVNEQWSNYWVKNFQEREYVVIDTLIEISHMNMKSCRNQSSSGEPTLTINGWLWIGPKLSHLLPIESIVEAYHWRIYGRSALGDTPFRSSFQESVVSRLIPSLVPAATGQSFARSPPRALSGQRPPPVEMLSAGHAGSLWRQS